jgi:DNA processing protein
MAMRQDTEYWIALNLAPGIGARTGRMLLKEWGSPAEIFKTGRKELEKFGLGRESVESLEKGEIIAEAESQLKRLEQMGAKIITLEESDYPDLLREIPDPPLVLYVLGNYSPAAQLPAIAIVGSRRCSTYGRHAAEMLSCGLAERGIAVVSGLARGIDTAAHRAALDASGKTLAVLGSGLDEIYPKENKQLADEIRESGALLTELPLGSPPLAQNFPFRNRIISGLCYGVLVVEAADRSGSLITARMAMEQNREVFAVPGNITSSNSFGPNYLIKDGAKLVQSCHDIIEELPIGVKARLLAATSCESSASLQQELFPLSELSENEQKVYDLLRVDESRHIDELSCASGLSPSQLFGVLFELEVKDKIKQLPGKNFIKLAQKFDSARAH